jgi:chitinase
MNMRARVGLVIFFLLPHVAWSAEPKIVGYFANWNERYNAADIPAEKLTHINYAFASIQNGECTVGRGDNKLKQLRELKEKHADLRILLSIGGWTGSAGFSDAAASKESREKFARSCATAASKYALDGVDIDWEFPGGGGYKNTESRPQDTKNFTLLLGELRAQLGHDRLLTIAAPAGAQAKRIELDQIHRYLDFINLMTYDFAGPWSARTGINAPLLGASSTDSAVKNYLAAGVPKNKLIVGVPFYGRAWTGVKDVNHGLDQPHDAARARDVESGEEWTYRSIANHYVGHGPTRYWHEQARVPWLFDASKGLMISYDDPESIRLKSDYVRQQNLGGVMIWELSEDDETSSLLGAIHAGLQDKTNAAAPAR